MIFFENRNIYYKDDQLYIEGLKAKDLAKKYGTPLYVYSKKEIIERFNKFDSAFNKLDHKIYFAAKSNFNLTILALMNKLGAGIDVNSKGELFRALKAGVNSNEIIFSGVGKTEEEIRFALENKISLLKAESFQEIKLINEIATALGVVAPIAIRVNPDVNPKTHPYISTGLAENKFGIDSTEALKIYRAASELPNISLRGLDMHIGSQITKPEPLVEAVIKISELYHTLKEEGIVLKHIDIGGGFGVRYDNNEELNIEELSNQITPILKELNCKILFEPGRFFVANAGILITKVLYTKTNVKKNFIIVDAAMTDLLRPSLYDSYHHIQPLIKYEKKDITADIVGPVCESGDYFAKNRDIQESKPGDYLAVMSAGAYGSVMSSNYNGRRKAAEILIDNHEAYLIKKRESFEDLIRGEQIPKESLEL